MSDAVPNLATPRAGFPEETGESAPIARIAEWARTQPLRHALVIASDAPDGVALGLAQALRENPARPEVHWIGPPPIWPRGADGGNGHLTIYEGPSLAASELPGAWAVAAFYAPFGDDQAARALDRLERARADFGGIEGPGAIDRAKAETGVDAFDLVVIDGTEFAGPAEFAKARGAGMLVLGGVRSFRGRAAHADLSSDAGYEAVADHPDEGEGWAVFRRRPDDALPIHFFTIVLNGEPFIRHHETVFDALPFRWHWHIVEGVAALTHDTAWSVGAGGRVIASVHDRGRSNDGTSAYLDALAARRPDRVTLYRKPLDQFWDGKREMVNAPLPAITEPCLLWQIDADEVWTAEAIATARAKFLAEPGRTAAFYWCDFFVGPERVISTRHNYGQNAEQEWLRTWRFAPGMRWTAHEPPTLTDGEGRDVGRLDPFRHDEMEEDGVVFQHFAYATPTQAAFKETYYGYRDALAHWRRLCEEASGSVLARDYLPWVTDDALTDAAAARGIVPIAVEENGVWRFRKPAEVAALKATLPVEQPRIVIDGAVFAEGDAAVRRMWTALLREWVASGFTRHVVLLDRAGTAPRLPGLRLRTTVAVTATPPGPSLLLERICREERAALFVTTGAATPTATPSAFFGLADPRGETRRFRAAQHASVHILPSAEAVRVLETHLSGAVAEVVVPGAPGAFRPPEPDAVSAFRRRHGLDGPYVLTTDEPPDVLEDGNVFALFRALGLDGGMAERLSVVCLGETDIGAIPRALAPRARVTRLAPSEDELPCVYAGAVALVPPRRGGGALAQEALACGCPVVTRPDPSLPDAPVGAARRVESAAALAEALGELLDPDARGARAVAGPGSVAMAGRLADRLADIAARVGDGRLPRPRPIWAELATRPANAAKGEAQGRVDLERRLEQSERNLRALRRELASMTNSPFWRLRALTLAALGRLGLRWRR